MTNISARSFQFVFPNQTIVGTTVLGGGFQYVLSGGETIGTVINGGIQLAGGTEDNTIINGGGEQFVFSSSEFLVFSGLGSSLNASAISAIEANVALIRAGGSRSDRWNSGDLRFHQCNRIGLHVQFLGRCAKYPRSTAAESSSLLTAPLRPIPPSAAAAYRA